MLAPGGIVLQKFYSETHITMHQLIFSLWGQSWPSYLRWDHCFQVSQNKIKWLIFVKSLAHQVNLIGLMDSSLRNNLDTISHNNCPSLYHKLCKMPVRKLYSWYQICLSMILKKDLQLWSAFSIHSSRCVCQYRWTHHYQQTRRLLTAF